MNHQRWSSQRNMGQYEMVGAVGYVVGDATAAAAAAVAAAAAMAASRVPGAQLTAAEGRLLLEATKAAGGGGGGGGGGGDDDDGYSVVFRPTTAYDYPPSCVVGTRVRLLATSPGDPPVQVRFQGPENFEYVHNRTLVVRKRAWVGLN